MAVSSGKRKRQRANREARSEADRAIPEFTDADLDGLLDDITVRADCEHASTRTAADSLILIRCAVGASVGGGCPRACGSFEKRQVGGYGLGLR